MLLIDCPFDFIQENKTRVKSLNTGSEGVVVGKEHGIKGDVKDDWKDDFHVRWDNGNESAIWRIWGKDIEVI